jgi:hypothetical protein
VYARLGLCACATRAVTSGRTHLLTLNATSGALSRRAIHWPESRNMAVRKAWAIISGRTNCGAQGGSACSSSVRLGALWRVR